MNVTRGAICRLDLFGRTPVQPLKASLEHEGDPHGPADQAQSTTRLPLTRLTGRTDAGGRRSTAGPSLCMTALQMRCFLVDSAVAVAVSGSCVVTSWKCEP